MDYEPSALILKEAHTPTRGTARPRREVRTYVQYKCLFLLWFLSFHLYKHLVGKRVNGRVHHKSTCASDFSKWVLENGGNEQIVSFLKSRGFTSKLSLQYLDLGSEDGRLLLQDLSIGQKCLLHGLVKLCWGKYKRRI